MTLDYKLRAEKSDSINKVEVFEVYPDGKEYGYTPHQFRVYFSFKDIAYNSGVELKNENHHVIEPMGNQNENKFEVDRTERIWGSLEINEPHEDTVLRMFGTDRVIEEITFNAYQVDEEFCSIAGIMEYNYEIDFMEKTSRDCLEISLGLKEKDFQSFIERINNKSISSHSLCLNNVAGFYAMESPTTHVPEIKVLVRDHKVDIPESFPKNFELPRIKNIGELSSYSTFKFELSKEEDEDDFDENPLSEPAEKKVLLSTSERLQKETTKEINKVVSLLEKQQKYFAFGFVILLITLVILSS